MASAVLASCAELFGVGTSVGAYLPNLNPEGSPVTGAAVTTAVVASDGSLAFTGLVDDTAYVAYDAGSGRRRRFRTARPAAGSSLPPRIGATLTDLNAAGVPVDGQVGLIRVGVAPDDHEEELVYNAALAKWIGGERVVLTTTDSWAMDLSRCPVAKFDNAWAKFSGGVGWEVGRPRTALRSAVTLPAATIDILDILNGPLAASGQVLIRDQLVAYTGVVTTVGVMQLTGCSGGTGTFAANVTPVIPWSSGATGGGEPGGWGTTVTPLDRVGELWAAGLRLQERANAWINGSVDLKAMSVAPFYLSYDLAENMGAGTLYPSANNAPIAGMLGPGLTLTGPAYDMGSYTTPGDHKRTSERGFEQRSAAWTAWAAAAPTKRYLTPVLYGKMAVGATDNGEVYGWTHRLRWVSP